MNFSVHWAPPPPVSWSAVADVIDERDLLLQVAFVTVVAVQEEPHEIVLRGLALPGGRGNAGQEQR